MDAPLACYQKAKKMVMAQQPPCFSEQARLALMQQEILIRYGHYSRAREVLTIWFDKLPSTSWMHEELVMIHATGVFYATQEWIVAAHITNMIHEQCTNCQLVGIAEHHAKGVPARRLEQRLQSSGWAVNLVEARASVKSLKGHTRRGSGAVAPASACALSPGCGQGHAEQVSTRG